MPQPSRPEPPMAALSKKVIAWVSVGIATASVALVVVLWWAGTSGLEGEELVAARLDALRTGLSIGLGGGGLFALYLAWRRQHSTEIGLAQKQQDQADVARAYELQRETFDATRRHQERVAAATERDAEARRITDLYTRAVEQLGSDKAPVRLGGLYALERLAQDHVEQRQTIVNVLCAYLRMPYTIPGGSPADDADDKLIVAHRERTQEREVRLTAQRILGHHLRPRVGADSPVETFWADIELDLTGAILIDFNLTRCAMLNAKFRGAAFHGDFSFIYATVTGDARFEDATFMGDASFEGATVTGNAWLIGATFKGDALFNNFTGSAWFTDTTFAGDATFENANFTDAVNFRNANFAGNVVFIDAKFRDVWFADAHFKGSAWFEAAEFTGRTIFRDASFEHANFERACFTGNTDFVKAIFQGDVRFDDATLPNTPYAGHSQREPWVDFRDVRFVRGVPPEVEQFVQRPGREAGDAQEAG